MLDLDNSFLLPEGLIVADIVDFRHKVNRFIKSGDLAMHAVFDFDRTLTVKHTGTQDDVTTWQILGGHLPKGGLLAYRTLYDKYRALELKGELTHQQAVTWWSASLDFYVKYKVNLAAVEETFLERASIRPGTAALFKLLTNKGIPTVILSAGVREVIDIWCRKYSIEPSLVISTTLIVDSDSTICGWQKDSLVHVLNKSEAEHPELQNIRGSRPKALLVGDSLEDASMAHGQQDVLRIRMLDPRADEFATEKEEQKTFAKFDALIRTGSFNPLIDLIEQMLP